MLIPVIHLYIVDTKGEIKITNTSLLLKLYNISMIIIPWAFMSNAGVF